METKRALYDRLEQAQNEIEALKNKCLNMRLDERSSYLSNVFLLELADRVGIKEATRIQEKALEKFYNFKLGINDQTKEQDAK